MTEKIRFHVHCNHCGRVVLPNKKGELNYSFGFCSDCRDTIGRIEYRKGARK